VGKFQGALSSYSAPQLGAIVVREVVRRAGLEPAQVDECVMGNVLAAGLGQNPARQAALFGGLPPEVSALTINKVCGSGLKAVALAVQAVQTGNAEIVVAGGMESMTNAPYLLPQARQGYRLGNSTLVDSVVHDGLWDVYNDYHMGITAENVAEKHSISRQEQDELAVASHQRAVAAQKDGILAEEIIPVTVRSRRSEELIDTDEHPRADTTVESLSKLKPVLLEHDPDATVTAGNASGQNDAASMCLVTTPEKAGELGLTPLVRLVSWGVAAVPPNVMGIGPVPATEVALAKAGLQLSDIDLIELNEAFAAQALAVMREWHFGVDDRERTNVHGSGISLGHPVGATGGRMLATLARELNRRDARYGLETMCIGGGQGLAAVFERVGSQ